MNKARVELFNLFEKDSAYNGTSNLWNDIPVVFDTSWDVNSEPLDYIFLREGVTDVGTAYGDGIWHKRRSDCDIMIVCSGNVDSVEFNKLDEEVARILANTSYLRINLGYDDKTKQSQITYAITIEV